MERSKSGERGQRGRSAKPLRKRGLRNASGELTTDVGPGPDEEAAERGQKTVVFTPIDSSPTDHCSGIVIDRT